MKPMKLKSKILAFSSVILLGGCYQSLDQCEEATGGICHISPLGSIVRGPGIPIDSPAGAAILGAALGGGGFYHPQPQPYYLPMPQVPQVPSYAGFTCSTLGASLTGIISCN